MPTLVTGENTITTVGSATYTVPAGTWDIAYTLIGGGGGGGGGKTNGNIAGNFGGSGGGGGAGQTKRGSLSAVSGNTTIDTTTGERGAGWSDGIADNGQNTSITVNGITYTANKGLGGKSWANGKNGGISGNVSDGGQSTLADGQNGDNGSNAYYYTSDNLGGNGGGTNNVSSGPGVGGKGGDYPGTNNATSRGSDGSVGRIVLTLSAAQSPSAPQSLVITPGNELLTFTFNASASGNPTSYTATIATNTDRTVILETKAVLPSSNNSFTNLINGQEYIIKVYATNSVGSSTLIDANRVPNGPAIRAIITDIDTSIENQLIVNFTPSTSPYPSYVRNYTVSLTAAGQTVVPQTVTVSPVTFTGLVAGVNYTAIVTTNYTGGTIPSASSSIVALGNALPVTISSAVVGNEQITVNFNASATPYSELNDYLITLTPTTGDPKPFSVPATDASSFSKICTGLEKFMEYTVQVETRGKGTPVNTTSVISTNTPQATPTGDLLQPSSITVDVNTLNQVSISATPVVGATSYEIQASSSNGNPLLTKTNATLPIVLNTADGLLPGTVYTFSLRGVRGELNGILGSSSAIQAPGAPYLPPSTDISVTNITTNSAVVNINKTNLPKGLIYYCSATSPNESILLSDEVSSISSSSSLAFSFNSLLLGTTYTLAVHSKGQTVNDTNYVSGKSAYSSPITFTTLNVISPSIASPLNFGNGTLEVNFTPATQGAGITVTGYTVSLSPGTASQNIIADGPYKANFTGLTNGVTYTATVTVNATSGSASATATGIPNGPDAPTAVHAVPSTGQNTIPTNGKAVVSFTHPIVPAGGSSITGYTVTASLGGATATGSASPITVEGLTNGNEYTFTVTAKNALQNVSEASLASLGVTPTSVPGAPTLDSAVAGDHTVTITFTAPTNTGGVNISSYSVFCVGNGNTVSLPASSSPFVYPNLQNGKEYTFSVCAVNYNGSSASSNSLKATPASLAVRELMDENVNVIPDVETFIESVNELTINDGGLVNFTGLGVDLSVLNTDEDKKKIAKKLINSVFEAKTELNNFMVEKSAFPIVSSNAKDNILVVKANEPFEIANLESTTSIYVAIETVGDSNIFRIGTDEFTIAKTSLGYNFIYNNTTTSHIDGGETRVNDLLIVFGGGSVSFDPLNNSTPHCYARGTLIGTSRGWVPIEDLLMSDKLRSYDLIKESMFKPVGGVPFKALVRVEDTRFKNRFAGIKFIGKFTVNSMNKNTAPIRITAGALGENKPERDLLVSPNHSMLISNRLIFAKFLVNGSTIYQDMSFNKIEYFHVLSDDHYIISANGALSETLGTEEFKLFETMIYAQSQIYQPLASEKKYPFTEMAF